MILAGTNIICSECEIPVGRTTRDLNEGEIIFEEMFEFLDGQQIRAGERMECCYCRGPWGLNGRFHTKEGWVS